MKPPKISHNYSIQLMNSPHYLLCPIGRTGEKNPKAHTSMLVFAGSMVESVVESAVVSRFQRQQFRGYDLANGQLGNHPWATEISG